VPRLPRHHAEKPAHQTGGRRVNQEQGIRGQKTQCADQVQGLIGVKLCDGRSLSR
jgi:hypothetical protein